ncbi:MAG: aminomethyl-transferring glycine dehydrogenase [Chlorobi bacterium]|nr:aminomethyl-transferring glycine dehydrogenase [Chlorobiota bacterium]
MNNFASRHIGPRKNEISSMLEKIGVSSINELINETIPKSILLDKPLSLEEGISEYAYFNRIKDIASKNKIFKSYIGQGYYGTITPAVILRNILENPSWYTSYTPYQAEISQGRLEALLNFQTIICDLTGMEIANSSLLDEATSAAEAMIMAFHTRPRSKVKNEANIFFVDENIFPQTLDVLKTRSLPLGIELKTGNYNNFSFSEKVFGAIVQYPAANGEIIDYKTFTEQAHLSEATVVVAADILSLALLTPPGEWGADVVVGSTQRFGIPMGFGGPHAAYFASSEKYKRNIPGRIIGISVNAEGKNSYRMALQTREQHIKRERATSNICTAQALLATMAGMYAVYHGADGLISIAQQIHEFTGLLNNSLKLLGYQLNNKDFFDTITIQCPDVKTVKELKKLTENHKINLNYINKLSVRISIDETTSFDDLQILTDLFAQAVQKETILLEKAKGNIYFDPKFIRTSTFLHSELFKKYRSETEMMRYIKKLERKDISLTHSMISLGSCTMKLNAAVEMLPLSWPEFGEIHPFVPADQAEGYRILINELIEDLKIITGFNAVSLQPNSGAQGEYSGLMVINAFHTSNNESHRNIVLIPASAHGTNPASGVMAGLKVIVIKCDENGNIDVNDLKAKAEENKDNLAAFMVTYPSTHGVFESQIAEMTQIIHHNGGLVYMDGANMNAQVGYTNPANIGADVCHLNLHKTFGIPHGGGGPGVGPIAVNEKLEAFLPGHSLIKTGGNKAISAISAAPFGSASILTIAHAYIKLLGKTGLKQATAMAILNANYLASSLKDYYNILYTGEKNRVAHEMILECRNFKATSGITELDIAKRLMDYGFHAPTLSFPVHGTLMVEPTESESLQELNRFIKTMISIYNEIKEIEDGKADKVNNVLKNAPHTAQMVTSNNWDYSYDRQKAAFPMPWIEENKFWPASSRIDDAYGDRNLVCTCNPIEDYE